MRRNRYNGFVRMRIGRKEPGSMKERPSTPQRRLLLDTLRGAKGHLDARELYRRALEKDPHISLATVYRNLRLFKELGLVDERRLDEVHCYCKGFAPLICSAYPGLQWPPLAGEEWRPRSAGREAQSLRLRPLPCGTVMTGFPLSQSPCQRDTARLLSS